MLNMIEKQEIIIGYFRQGKSKKQLAKALGISRNTVRAYIREHEQSQAKTDSSLGLPQAPSYDSSNRKRRALTKEVCQLIDEYLAENKRKQASGRSKQQMLGTDIHEALLEKGHQIGYRTVMTYIKAHKDKSREVFIRQDYEAGQAVEFDWGYVDLDIGGVGKKLMLAVFTSSYSNHRWARLYCRQDMSSFLDAHACYFTDVSGVAGELIYDNMRTVIRKYTLRNKDKLPTEDLLRLSAYYQFDYRFCNARRGNEKGKVERSVEYVRRKSFSRKDSFETLQAANEYLHQRCRQLNERKAHGQSESIAERFSQELAFMRPSPARYDSAQWRQLKVDKYSCVKVDLNFYSVSEGHVGQLLDVKVYPNTIEVYNAQNECIGIHERQHTRFDYYIKLDHYLITLSRKPGALAGSLGLQQADGRLRHWFNQHFKHQPKVFIELLLWMKQEQHTIEQVQLAIDKCLRICPHQSPDLDKIKVLVQQAQQPIRCTIKPAQDSMSATIAKHCQDQLAAIATML